MPWDIHRWILLFCVILFMFKGCQNLFLRHTLTGKCIARSEKLVYNNSNYAFPYYVVMSDNCLDNKAQFRYLDSQLLHNIEMNGTLVSPIENYYKARWVVYKGVASPAKTYQTNLIHRLKQTTAGSLHFYNMKTPACAEPSSTYLLTKTYCNKSQQDFTFGKLNGTIPGGTKYFFNYLL